MKNKKKRETADKSSRHTADEENRVANCFRSLSVELGKTWSNANEHR